MSTTQTLKELQKELQRHKRTITTWAETSDTKYFYDKVWNTAINRCDIIIEEFIQCKKYESSPDIKNKTRPLYSLLYKLDKEYQAFTERELSYLKKANGEKERTRAAEIVSFLKEILKLRGMNWEDLSKENKEKIIFTSFCC